MANNFDGKVLLVPEKDLPIKDFDQNIQEIIDTDTFWKHADNYAFLVD